MHTRHIATLLLQFAHTLQMCYYEFHELWEANHIVNMVITPAVPPISGICTLHVIVITNM